MGCSASKATAVVTASPLPAKQDENNNERLSKTKSPVERQTSGSKIIKIKESEDSLRGSLNSLTSASDSSNKSDRESSAKSTRTTDSGLGELEDDPNIITENTTDSDKLKEVKIDERPSTPDLSIEGTKVPRRKTLKEKRVSFGDREEYEQVKNRINSLAPLGGIIERPESRGGMAFDIVLCPETGNRKRRPHHLKSLEKRKKKSKKLTKEQLEEKMRHAEEKRREHNQHIKEKAQQMISARDRQVKTALDEFARRQMEQETNTSS